MTQVRVGVVRPSAIGAPVLVSGRMSWAPHARRVVDGDVQVPSAFQVPLDGLTRPVIEVSSAWVWRVSEFITAGAPSPLYLMVPESSELVDYADLVEVDPATLEPAESAVPAWEAAVSEVRGYRDDTVASTATAKSKAEAAQLSAAHAENAQADAEQARSDAQTAAAAAHLDVDHDTTIGCILTRGTA